MLETRISSIVEKLEKRGNVQVRDLAEQFGVTEKTIRHDLVKMEKMGLLKRVHGGAVSIIKQAEDAYSNSARTVSLQSKEVIARMAHQFFSQFGSTGEVFFIDAGTTNYEFARLLTNSSAIIITNDLLIASKLSTSSVSLHLTGGKLFNNVNKYLIGIDAINMINKHHASICFIGASSISLENGLMTLNNEDMEVKRAMISNSAKVVCLADHSKFDKKSFVKFADVEEIDIIITDKISESLLHQFEEKGIQVIAAETAQ